jgi:hypothetical protein
MKPRMPDPNMADMTTIMNTTFVLMLIRPKIWTFCEASSFFMEELLICR